MKPQTATIRLNKAQQFLLRAGALLGAAAILLHAHSAYAEDKIKIGYWPIAGGLPFFVALEKGYFKEAGLDVEGVKFAAPPQIVEAMIAGRIQGSANGTASAALAVGDIASPGFAHIFASNPSNHHYVLDEFLVAANSPFKTIADLKGKKVASGPGIQNVTLAKAVLEKNGIENPQVIELPVGQHVAALAAGQIDAVYTLEPTGTIGRMSKMTRVLETGVIAKYVLGKADAPWFGGSASLTTVFINQSPEAAKKLIAAYGKGIDFVRKHPDEARQYLNGYTSIDKTLASEVPIPGYKMYNEFTPSDIEYFQKFFDLFFDRKIFTRQVLVPSMLYK
ncbi:MAG TPA: ABC transporter substrate-binding protein [Burkholderiaceae bacterium]|jgi:NitT/TauT family transport system substrate-binding protein